MLGVWWMMWAGAAEEPAERPEPVDVVVWLDGVFEALAAFVHVGDDGSVELGEGWVHWDGTDRVALFEDWLVVDGEDWQLGGGFLTVEDGEATIGGLTLPF